MPRLWVVKKGPCDKGEAWVGRAVVAGTEVGADPYAPLETTFPFLSHLSLGFALHTAAGTASLAAGPRCWLAPDLKVSWVFPCPGHTALFTVVPEC